MKRFFVGCFCSWAVLGPAVTGWSADDDKSLIVAGERIGQVQVNREGVDLTGLGEPSTTDAALGGKSYETWYSKSADGQNQEMSIYAHPTDGARKHSIIVWVYVTSPFFHTAAGVSTRSEPTAIWREFPRLTCQEESKTGDGRPLEFYASAKDGIGFLLERDPHSAPGKSWGKCRAIMVCTRGTEGDVIQVPRLR